MRPHLSRRRRSRRVGALASTLVALLSLAALLPANLAAQSRARSATFLILRGNDTLVVERVQRQEQSESGMRTVTAQIAVVSQPRVSLSFTLGSGHSIPTTSFSVFGPNAPIDATPLQSGTVQLTGDSAFLDLHTSTGVRTLRLGTRAGALPVMNNDFVVLEQLVRMARSRGVTTLTVPLFALAGGQTIDGTLDLVGRDSARFRVADNVTEVAIDATGNVTGGVLPAQGMRIAVVEGAESAKISLGRPDYSAPAGAPYTAEEVTVPTTAGHTLAGTFTRPVGATERIPAVVTVTGSGMQDRDEYVGVGGGYRLFRQVADTLGRRGIAVLRLDDRGG